VEPLPKKARLLGVEEAARKKWSSVAQAQPTDMAMATVPSLGIPAGGAEQEESDTIEEKGPRRKKPRHKDKETAEGRKRDSREKDLASAESSSSDSEKQVRRRKRRKQTSQPTVQEQSTDDFSVFHANMDGFKTHAVDVEAQIQLLDREPDMVLLNETKLDEGDPPLVLTGYTLICRRDRVSVNKGGGVAVFAKTSKAARVTLLE